MLPALKPIMMRERVSLIFIEYGRIDVVDSAFVVIDKNGVRTYIPIGGVACIMLVVLGRSRGSHSFETKNVDPL